MGTEIIVISIANLWILCYSITVRLFQLFLFKLGVLESQYGRLYRSQAAVAGVFSLLPSIYFLASISSDYRFAVTYIAILQVPLISLTLLVLMPLKFWKNLTTCSS